MQQQATVNIHTPEHALVFFVIMYIYIYGYIWFYNLPYMIFVPIYLTWFLVFQMDVLNTVNYNPPSEPFACRLSTREVSESMVLHRVMGNLCTQNAVISAPRSFAVETGRLTWNWNLQLTHIIFQTSMIMFHVNLQGCSFSFGFWWQMRGGESCLVTAWTN